MKILISGAGIAGFTLAYWLKQRGFTPTIVEKYPSLRKGGYKVDVRGTALEVVRRMGIYPDLLNANVKLKRSQFVTPDLKVFEFEGDILGHPSEEDLDVNRWDLSQIIAMACGEIEIIYGDSIVQIEEKVHFEKMSPRTFDIVVGADGIHSNVRKLVFGDESTFLKEYGVHFCVFPIPNLFNLDRSEIVYFDKGKLVSAYAAENHSFACLAFKSENNLLPRENLKSIFEERFKNTGWEIPRFVAAMKESNDCYFDTVAQIRMPAWSKGNVVLVGDAAHAASSIGTSLAIVGAYILAQEIEGDYPTAFARYEKSMRKFVERGQNLAQSNLQIIANAESSWLIKLQLYLMKLLPEKFIRLSSKWERWQMKRAANSLKLDSYVDPGRNPRE
ncbi:MAG: FAD-dependent monooxygenase [Verrucomicrobia bacterium]|nr:FAD-dependent monooxygenase [Verrucomicrobiota bacterium]